MSLRLISPFPSVLGAPASPGTIPPVVLILGSYSRSSTILYEAPMIYTNKLVSQVLNREGGSYTHGGTEDLCKDHKVDQDLQQVEHEGCDLSDRQETFLD